ncbi:unnamed protein product [Closterium sp. Naga37s-1]|nr:unnamed protein product [Closterium sp. Naga37s-1]
MASPSDAASKEDEFFAQRRTVLAVLDFLRTAPLPPSVDSDALEVAADCLSEAFGVNPQNPDDLEKYSVLPGTLLQLIQDSTPGSATGHGSSAGAARPGGQLVENSQAAASLPEPMDEENKRDAEPREADLGDRVGGGSVAAGTENARIGNGASGGREGGKEVEMKDAVEGAAEQTGEQAKERAWETARGEAGAGVSGPNRQGEEGQVEAQGALDLEKKLQEFLQGLESAGYYAGTVVGSEEYVTRQQQARAIFHQCGGVVWVGNAAMAAHNYEEALSLYSKAIALCGGTNAIYYANRAAAQHQLGNYMEAAADSRRAVAVDPRYSKAYSRLGHACMALGRHHEAIEEGFKKALELDPSNAAHKENLKAKIRPLQFTLSFINPLLSFINPLLSTTV